MFEYQLVNVTLAKPYTIDGTANSWAKEGWRTVAVIPPQGPGHAASILVEREIKDRVMWMFSPPPKGFPPKED